MLAIERNKVCEYCGETYYNPYGVSISQWNKRKYCSYKCARKIDVIRRLKLYADEAKHPRWKGDQVGYFGVHDWITKHYGQPKECENCGLRDIDRKYHWANLDGKYNRDRESWKRMCVSCHRKYDYARKRESITIN